MISNMIAYMISHLESCHLHMNWQNCTYTSEACTYMYRHVHDFMYTHVHVYTCTCFYIMVCSMYIHVYAYIYLYIHGTYTYLHIYICTYHVHTRSYSLATTLHSHQAQSALRRRRVSAPRRFRSFRAASFLSSVFSTDRPPRRGLPRPNCHSHAFTSYTLLPRRPSAAAESQVPTGKPDLLCWLYL